MDVSLSIVENNYERGKRSISPIEHRLPEDSPAAATATNREIDPVGVLGGSRNVRFADMQSLVEAFGFTLARVSGSHHIFSHPDVPELVNLQEVGGQAKP